MSVDPPSVLVADRRPVIGQGLAAALSELLSGQVSAVATERDLRTALATRAPRVLVVLLERDDDGLLAAALRAAPEGTDVLVLVPADRLDEARAKYLWAHGVRAMVPATATVQALSTEIAKLGATLGDAGSRAPAEGRSSESADDAGPAGSEDRLTSLTPRESQVLDLLARGRSTREIAESLSISVNTVRAHVNMLLHKLGVHSRLRAVALYTDVAPSSSPSATAPPRR